MKISIVITKRNYREYYQAAIDSFLAQTEKPFEILLSENHSTDGSFDEVIEKFSSSSKVRLIVPPTPLDTHAKSVAFAVSNASAEADYICIAAADDYWKPNFIKEMNKALEYYKLLKPKLLYCDRFLFDAKMGVFGCSASFKKPMVSSGLEAFERYSASIAYNISGAVWESKFIKSTVKNVEWSGDAADWIYSMEAARKGVIIYYPKILLYYRIHRSSTSRTDIKVDTYEKSMLLYQKHLEKDNSEYTLKHRNLAPHHNDSFSPDIDTISAAYQNRFRKMQLLVGRLGLSFFLIKFFNILTRKSS
ncbi:MAG: glycosyltransferase [Flammeovirgaceae bacterium]|nr:glycosyltransferase [Flammeovirgaceae bacterium]